MQTPRRTSRFLSCWRPTGSSSATHHPRLVKDYDAVATSREYLWDQFGQAWGPSPSADLTLEQDLIDLAWHQRKAQRRSSFTYAVMRPGGRVQLAVCTSTPPPSRALTPQPPCGSGPAGGRRPGRGAVCDRAAAGLPIAGRLLGLPGLAGSCHGDTTTRCPTSDPRSGLAGSARRLGVRTPRALLAPVTPSGADAAGQHRQLAVGRSGCSRWAVWPTPSYQEASAVGQVARTCSAIAGSTTVSAGPVADQQRHLQGAQHVVAVDLAGPGWRGPAPARSCSSTAASRPPRVGAGVAGKALTRPVPRMLVGRSSAVASAKP